MNNKIKEINITFPGQILDYVDTKDHLLELFNYINNLQTISDNRMKTLLKIEQYCIDEKEDLISGGEVCENVLKSIDELKGK